MKKIILPFLLNLFFYQLEAQSFNATYNFTNVSNSTGLTDPTTVPAATGVTFGSFVCNLSGTTNPNAAGRFSFVGWPTGASNGSNTFTGSINTSSYYEVSITCSTDYLLTLSSISFTIQRSGTGIRQFSVRSNVDNYSTNLNASISPANSNLSVVSNNVFQIIDGTSAEVGSTISLSTQNFTNILPGSIIKFRFYGWNAEASTGSFSIDDVVISGSAKEVNSWNSNGIDYNWNTNSNWSKNHFPTSTENVLISSGSPSLNVDYEIPSAYSLSISGTGSLTINPGKKLTVTGAADFGGKSVTVSSDATGSGAIVLNGGTLSNATNVTLQQWLTGQRAWRVLSNPFNSSITASAISNSNSAISVNQNGVNDIVQYNSASDNWSLASSIAANTCYAFFYKGLQADFTGNVGGLNNYSGNGPTATAYSVTGTLNTAGVSITPVASSGASVKYTLVGNPFAAPVNTQALTGNASLPYYYYSASSGSTDIKIKSGAWIAASSNSSTTTTIPMMGVIAYESPNSTAFSIATSAINNTGTSNNSLFKTTAAIKNLELNLYRNSNLHDRLIIREDAASAMQTIDVMDLNKMENINSNLYAIASNNQHLAVQTEHTINQAIPLGIDAPLGLYELRVGANTFGNADIILIDHYLNQQQIMQNGASYTFEITADPNTKGEHRFELAKQSWSTNVNNLSAIDGVQILNNVVIDHISLFVSATKKNILYTLLDINGALIAKGNLPQGEVQINTQALAQGMYVLHVNDENKHVVYKIIKQ